MPAEGPSGLSIGWRLPSVVLCLLSIALPVLALFALAAPRAKAFIYWADTAQQRIARADNNGSHIDNNFIATGLLPFAVTVDASHIYWANQESNSIGRANIDGTGVDNSFITGVTKPTGVAVNANSIFWSTIGGPIGRADIDGLNKNTNFITPTPFLSCGVAVDSGHLYWADDATGTPAYIGRSGLDGFNVEGHFITIPDTSFPCGIAVDSANIFWTETGFFFPNGTRIGRASKSTKVADPSYIGDASGPCGIAIFGSQLYWANAGANTIGRANTDATGVTQSYFNPGGGELCGIAVDSLTSPPAVPPPPPAPSVGAPRTSIVKGPGSKLGKGEAKFSFKSSQAGSRFECKLDSRKAAKCKSPKRYTGLKPGKHAFKVWATNSAGDKDQTPAKRRFKVPR